jgi:ATP-dependent Lon protease
LEEAQKNGDFIGIVSQKNSDLEQPAEKDLYQTGTLAKIIKIIKLPEGNITAITKGFTDLK